MADINLLEHIEEWVARYYRKCGEFSDKIKSIHFGGDTRKNSRPRIHG